MQISKKSVAWVASITGAAAFSIISPLVYKTVASSNNSLIDHSNLENVDSLVKNAINADRIGEATIKGVELQASTNKILYVPDAGSGLTRISTNDNGFVEVTFRLKIPPALRAHLQARKPLYNDRKYATTPDEVEISFSYDGKKYNEAAANGTIKGIQDIISANFITQTNEFVANPQAYESASLAK